MSSLDLTGLDATIGGAASLLAAAGATPAAQATPGATTPTDIPVDRIDPFPHHPYRVRDDQDMECLVDSIRAIGIQSPLLVRPTATGRYQLVSGHRRLHAARTLGHRQVPCLIADLDDDQATLAMVDSNQTTRTSIPLAEQARAMRMRHQAATRQGVRGAGDTRARLAAENATSATSIARLVRLGGLEDRLLDQTGTPHGIPKGAALTLTTLTGDTQTRLADWLQDHPGTRIDATAAHALADTERRDGHPLDPDTIGQVLARTGREKPARRPAPLPAPILDAIPADITGQGGQATLDWILRAIRHYTHDTDTSGTGRTGKDTRQ